MAQGRRPLVLLILDAAAPVPVQRMGRIDIVSAVERGLDGLLADFAMPSVSGGVPRELIEQAFAWTTWDRIAEVVHVQEAAYVAVDASSGAAIERITEALRYAIGRQRERVSAK